MGKPGKPGRGRRVKVSIPVRAGEERALHHPGLPPGDPRSPCKHGRRSDESRPRDLAHNPWPGLLAEIVTTWQV